MIVNLLRSVSDSAILGGLIGGAVGVLIFFLRKRQNKPNDEFDESEQEIPNKKKFEIPRIPLALLVVVIVLIVQFAMNDMNDDYAREIVIFEDDIVQETNDFMSNFTLEPGTPTKNETVKNYYNTLLIMREAEDVYILFDDTTYDESPEITVDDQIQLAVNARDNALEAMDFLDNIEYAETEISEMSDYAHLYLNSMATSCDAAIECIKEDTEENFNEYMSEFQTAMAYRTSFYISAEDYLIYYLSEDEISKLYTASDNRLFLDAE